MLIPRLKRIGLLVLALVACAACQTTLPFGSSPVSEATTLTLEATAQGNGEFALVGTTNLPNDTQLTAIALRHLLHESTTSSDRPLYSVLDYQPVTVANGQWSAQLNLWQVASDGRYQEPWQAEAAALGLAAQPSKTVQFAIVLAPHHLGAALNGKLAQNGQQRLANVLRVTSGGEPFLWADQALAVALPSGQTTPPADLLARTNGGWGDRYLLVPEPPLPYTLTPADERQTSAPLGPDELLR